MSVECAFFIVNFDALRESLASKDVYVVEDDLFESKARISSSLWRSGIEFSGIVDSLNDTDPRATVLRTIFWEWVEPKYQVLDFEDKRLTWINSSWNTERIQLMLNDLQGLGLLSCMKLKALTKNTSKQDASSFALWLSVRYLRSVFSLAIKNRMGIIHAIFA